MASSDLLEKPASPAEPRAQKKRDQTAGAPDHSWRPLMTPSKLFFGWSSRPVFRLLLCSLPRPGFPLLFFVEVFILLVDETPFVSTLLAG